MNCLWFGSYLLFLRSGLLVYTGNDVGPRVLFSLLTRSYCHKNRGATMVYK